MSNSGEPGCVRPRTIRSRSVRGLTHPGSLKRSLSLIAFIALTVFCAVAEEAPLKRPDSSSDVISAAKKEKLDFYRRMLREYRVVVDGRGDQSCELNEEPLTRWDNPISQNADGMLFLWTDRGRPVVMMNGFYNVQTQIWGRVFMALTDRPVEMRHGEELFWKPQMSGSPLKPLPGAKAPADTAAARLVQMRNIAKEFQVICNWGGKDKADWQLRLLTAPLYRYAAPSDGIVDGALFGYIQSGPEGALLVEAHKTPSGLEWRYSTTRCTTYRIRFVRNDAIIAEYPHIDEWVRTEPFFPLRTPLAEYPFANPFEGVKGAKGDKK